MKEPIDLVIFKNQSTQYGVMHAFREGLTKGLESIGARVRLLEFNQGIAPNISSIYRYPPDCTLAFNGPHQLKEGIFLADKIEIPHFAWLLDGAYYFSEMAHSLYYRIICPDEDSRKWMSQLGSQHAYFLPHAFDAALYSPPTENPHLPIVFLGSLIDYLEIESEWKKELPKQLLKAFLEGSDKVLFSRDFSIPKVFDTISNDNPFFFDKLEKEKIYSLIQSFDLYIRGKHRVLLLNGLKDFPLHIFGNPLGKRTWNDFLDEGGNYKIHPSLDFQEAVKVMKNSAIILNSSPMFKGGAHERIFYGLGLGSLVLTNETRWLKTHFEEGEELLSYDLSCLEKTCEQLTYLLAQSEKRKALIEKGQQKVLQKHTWKQRAEKLIEIIESELEDLS